MKRTTLSARDAAWLASAIERNRAMFAGWRMEHDGEGEGEGEGSGETGTGGEAGSAGASDNGFPSGTPVEQMTPDQQVAYYRHQARKHEDRNKDILKLTGGKYGDDLKAVFDELQTLRNEKLTDSEKAVEEAKRAAREEAAREFGPRMARLAFETALAHRDDRDDLIAALNLTSVLTESGDVDTAKVRSIVEKIAPADKEQGQRHDFGAGRRGTGGTKTGVAAGAELYAARRKTSTAGS